MYYRRDPAPLTRTQTELSKFALGERFGYSFVVFCVAVSGPALTFASYARSEGPMWLTEPRLGAWTWYLFVLLPLGPIAFKLRQTALARHYVYVYEYWSDTLPSAFKDCMRELYELPKGEEQRRPLWLDAVKAFETKDVARLKELTKLLIQLGEALERRNEAQRLALHNKFIQQDTLNRIEALDLETEALQKELTP